MTDRILGIIPARAGSRGIPHKNTVLLGGKPLIAYTLEAAQGCGQFDHLVVTTDCELVTRIADEYGIAVIHRPPELANDTTTSDKVVTHTLEKLREDGHSYDAFVLLQPTSPLRTDDDISNAINLFHKQQNRGSVISVVHPDKHPMKSFQVRDGSLYPWIDEESLSSPRQLLPELLQCDGAIYITATDLFNASNSFYSQPVTPYFTPKHHDIDIDGPDDLEEAAFYLKRQELHSQ